MRVLFVHPGPLPYARDTQVFLRLEPLGIEPVAAAARIEATRTGADG